jgi:hypothetical protein
MQDRENFYEYSKGDQYRDLPMREVFTRIYYQSRWRVTAGQQSVSGPGSSLEQTRHLLEVLPSLFDKYGVRSVLDIPCGDFNWLKGLDWSRIRYTGADIVTELVEKNNRVHRSGTVSFLNLDLTRDRMPQSDLVLCRDCLVHFSLDDIRRAFANIRASGCRYLLTTTFPAEETNKDIVTGGWRLLNFQRPPFSFPAPLESINEHCSEAGGRFRDKSLTLWAMQELPYPPAPSAE